MNTNKTDPDTVHAVVQRRLPHIEVEDHPYDIGYWARMAGCDKPKDAEMALGWKQADDEMEG